MLGRGMRTSPQFIIIKDGSWLGMSVCMDRITHRWSADSAVYGKSSLTSSPLLPYFLNENGDGKAVPVLRSVRKLTGIGLPAHFFSKGLGSKLSSCDGPPFMKRWITRLALGAKCGGLRANGDRDDCPIASTACTAPTPRKTPARPNAAMPMPERHSACRREINLLSIDKYEFIGL